MRVKEAQILGILALVAAGIILICIWTGSEEQQAKDPAKTVNAQQQQQQGNPQAEVESVTDLNEMLRKLEKDASEEQKKSSGGSESKQAKGSLEVGGSAQKSKSSGSSSGQESAQKSQGNSQSEDDIDREDTAVSEQIESKEPEDVGLVSKEKATGGNSDSVEYVVKKGDTLAEISRKFYNTSSRWRDVLKANKGLISSPKGLRPDMKLTIPSPERVQVSSRSDKESVKQLVTRTSRSGSKVYKVKKGDTLYSIGKKFYDDASAWRRIREANSDIVDEEDKITPGMKLILP